MLNPGYYVVFNFLAIYNFDRPVDQEAAPITSSTYSIYFNNGLFYDTT